MTSALQEELFSETREKGNKPYFSNHSKVLEKYWKKIAPELKAYLKKELGDVPSFDNLEVEVKKLPTAYGENGDGKVFKVLGKYEPLEQKIYLDPVIFEELDDPERIELGYEEKTEDVIVHELIHHIQRSLGSLDQPHWYIEGAATKATEDVTGREQKSYPAEKEGVEKIAKEYELSPGERLKGAKKINLN